MLNKTPALIALLVIVLAIGGFVYSHPDPDDNCIGDEEHYSCEVTTSLPPTATATVIPSPTPTQVSTEQTRLLSVLNSITVQAEHTCYSSYTRSHYEHGVSGSKERQMAEGLGWVLPYSNTRITSDNLYGSQGTQIEHMVAAKEAHESGMGCRSVSDRKAFGRDSSNLTLALPSVNRGKSSKDLAEWLPQNNVCWFVAAIVEQKAEWNLSMDRAEWNTAKKQLQSCTDFSL